MDNEQHIADSQRPGGLEMIEPKSGWVSVNDRLPRKGERVLVYGEEIGMSSHIMHIDNEGYWLDSVSLYNHPWFIKITHWHPLPEPPKK